jgi:lipopolysaccharide biosynthesis glycosyltransferase
MRSSIWHKSVFYRFYIDKAFPNNKNKALYIDSDIFVNDSIHKLFNINLKNNVIGAIEDPGIAFNRNYLSKIKMQSDLYFNSGVLLINLKKWRSEKITNKLEKTIKKLGFNLKSPDQDLLNIVFEKKFKLINPKWNLQTIMYLNIKYWKYLNNTGIHHFTFIKPWRSFCTHSQTKNYKELEKKNGFEIKTNYFDLIELLKMTRNYIKYFFLFNIYKWLN